METTNFSDTAQADHLATSEILFSRVLVATDFSKQANQALRLAIVISQLFGAKLSLVHASSPVIYGLDNGPVPVEILNANLDAAKEEMDRLLASEPGLSELKPRVVVSYAEPVDLIHTVSREDKSDLIIVGSHAAGGLERLTLGSVAEAVLRQESCPVIIVGPNCIEESHPFRSILFATDLKTTGLRGAQYAAGLAERFHAKLTLLHVIDEDPVSISSKAEAVQANTRQELERLLPADILNYSKVKLRVEYGRPADVIAAVAESDCASFLVVGLRNRVLGDHTPWSTLGHVIREVKCPVLGVRAHLI